MEGFSDAKGKIILHKMVQAVQENKAYLGKVDGLIGDGDHGMNMNKGFTLFEERYGKDEIGFLDGLHKLGTILMEELGGSMGPIYGTIFMETAEALDGREKFHLEDFTEGLEAGLMGLYDIVDARIGDKTLVDALAPAVESLKKDSVDNIGFQSALEHMKEALETGRDSTENLIARYGRASRLGERSRGVLDAGACSCTLIFGAMAEGILEILENE